MFYSLLALIVAPAIFWIGYFYYHDRSRPEPLVLTLFGFLLGMTSAWLCVYVYDLLQRLGIPVNPETLQGFSPKFLAYCIGIVGIVEETLKFLPFLIIIRFRDFDERFDGIFYASAIALGFASYENLFYLPALKGLPLFGRAFASPLTHTIFASIWGYGVGMARIRRKPIFPVAIAWVLLAALAHGLFDFFTFLPLLRLGSALLILAIWIWRIRLSEHLTKKDREGLP